MANYTNPISNMSYTNKDFQTIYPELLDVVKKLTYRWDASISNESDPGVILLKLNAIIADKCNYAIDKGVLECFPVSVTQQKNARQLFKQLGYLMKWYNAASTQVSFRWIDELNDHSYIIPKFTMVCDSENSIVYTLINDGELLGDGSTLTVDALQGVAVNLQVGSSTNITTAMLDSNNRIYFPDTNVAENGVFITNTGSYNYDTWTRVNNLLVEKSGHYVYEFGVDDDEGACYLEFPEDAEDIFQEGINITYLRTDGANGNVGIRTLEQFYGSVTVTNPEDATSTVSLTTTNVRISNFNSSKDGTNPETIESAYVNYKRTVGTFDTLVTLRDYVNAVYQSQLVSNVIVSDRTTDIQNSYYTVSDNNSMTDTYRYIDKSDDVYYIKDGDEYIEVGKQDKLQAFDLKLYLFQWIPNPSTIKEYNTTFDLYSNNSSERNLVISYLDDVKSLQHNFTELQPNKPCFFKNVYPIVATIVPQYNLTQAQANDISNNISNAIFTNLNSSKMTFGKGVEYDDIFNILLNADSRIKSVVLSNIEYTTKMVYLEEHPVTHIQEFKEVDINDWVSFNTTGIDSFEETPIAYQMQCDIIAKSVLAGKTPYFYKNKDFSYSYKQLAKDVVLHIGVIDSEVIIGGSADIKSTSSPKETMLTIKDNQNLRFYAPNLLDDTEYSTYVLYEVSPNFPTVLKGSDYQLKNGEYITFFWKDSDDSESYTYCKYTTGDIIKPNFTLTDSSAGSYSNGYNRGSGLVPSATSVEIKENYTDSSSHYLSGTKSITHRKLNSITINPSSFYCYWITNTNKIVKKNNSDYYRLFDENVSEVILGEGEYFLYTSTSKDELAIVGAGTKITRTQTTGTWDCKAVEYSSIVSDGLEALKSMWVTLPKDDIVSITEMQTVTLGSGVTVKITPTSTTANLYALSFTSDCEVVGRVSVTNMGSKNKFGINIYKFMSTIWSKLSISSSNPKFAPGVYTAKYKSTTTDNVNFAISYKLVNGSSTIDWANISLPKSSWKEDLGLDIELSELNVDDSIYVYGSANGEKTEEQSDMPTLADFLIQYQTQDSEWTALPTLSLNDVGWSGRSNLLLRFNSDEGQELHDNETITYHYCEDDSHTYDQVGTITGSSSTTYYIQASEKIDSDGGSGIQTAFTYDDGTSTELNLYQYSESDYVDTKYFTFGTSIAQIHLTQDAYNTPLNPTGTGTAYNKSLAQFSFRLPKNKRFLIPISLPSTFDSAGITDVMFYYGNEKLEDVVVRDDNPNVKVLSTYLSKLSKITKSGTYYYMIDTTGDNTYNEDTPYESDWYFGISINYVDTSDETGGPVVDTSVDLFEIFDVARENSNIITPYNIETEISDGYSLPEIPYRIYKLDYDHKFKFTYEVSDDELIDNPLDADSFLDTNHIYNNYTICQFNTNVKTDTQEYGTLIKIINKGK